MRKLKAFWSVLALGFVGLLFSAQSALAATNTTEMVEEATDMIYALWPLLILIFVISLIVGLLKKMGKF